MRRTGRLIVFVAPSGAGKTTVIHRFLQQHPDMAYSISSTTRPIRPGEIDGRDYHFLTDETFQKGIELGHFVEWARVHDHWYGTLRAPLDAALQQGLDMMLDLDVVGSLRLKELYGDQAVAIFILPPSRQELQRRLATRATDSEAVQQLRLTNALTEMTFADRFDHRVINDDLDRTCGDIAAILRLAPKKETP